MRSAICAKRLRVPPDVPFLIAISYVLSPHAHSTFIQLIKRGTRSLGYGFVTYETEAEAQKAVTMLNKKEIDGREINVEGAKPQPPPKSAENYSYAEGEEGASTRGRGRGRGGRGRGRGGVSGKETFVSCSGPWGC